jgi:hypothetical protein
MKIQTHMPVVSTVVTVLCWVLSYFILHHRMSIEQDFAIVYYIDFVLLFCACYTGSVLLDEAMSSVMVTGFITFIVLSMIMLIIHSDLCDVRCIKQLDSFIKNQAYYFKFLLNAEDVGSDKSISKIRRFGEEMIALAKYSFYFFMAILLFTAPIYFLKLFGIGESHKFQYRWLFNLVYMKGELIAVLMMLAWMGLIVLLFFIYYKCDMKRLSDRHGEAAKKQSSVHVEDMMLSRPKKPFDYKSFLQYFLLFLLNLFIVVNVNGSYIYSTYQDLHPLTTFLIQVGLAIFKMVYALMFVPILTREIKDPTTNIAVRSMLNLFNNLFIPCLATAFTSPTCYQVMKYYYIYIVHF